MARRTAELQRALASQPEIPDFAPEPVAAEDVTAWTERLIERASRTFELVAGQRRDLSETDRAMVDRMLQARDAIAAHIRNLLPQSLNVAKIRHHGDFHLGQILVVKDDAFILDFLNVVETDIVSLSLKDEVSQAVMKPVGAEGYDYTYVIMPMRI